MRDETTSDQPNPERLVFIGGLHRSGTTLLAELLGEHPDMSSLRDTNVPHDEGQHLQRVYKTAGKHGGPGQFAFDRTSHLTETDVGDAESERRALLSSWLPFWDTAKTLLVEKSPPNLLRFRYLQAVFPGAAFIAIVRHPIAVSYATQPWSRTSIPKLVSHWLRAHEQLADDRPHVGRLLVVRYEDLVSDVGGTLAHIDRELGIAPHETTQVVRTGTNDRYLARWHHTRVLPAPLRVEWNVLRFERRLDALGYGYSLRARP